MPDIGQGISVGDAVLEFIADTQKLDAGIDSVGAKVEAGMARSGAAVQQFGNTLDSTGQTASESAEVIQDAMQSKATPSIREARGEAMLLGEAFGVHMPREVRSFIAEMPGVGTALSAAFSATAILFAIEAITKLTEKASDFISTAFIYTEQMRAADAATAALNSVILTQEARLDAATKAFDRVGLSAGKLAKLKIGDELAAQIKIINDALAKQNSSLEKELTWWEKLKLGATDVLRMKAIGTAAQEEIDDRASKAAIERANNETQAEKARADARKTADEELAAERKKNALEHAAIYKKEMADLADYEEKAALSVLAEMDKINDAVERLPKGRNLGQLMFGNVDDFQKYEQAAQTLGITLKSNLVTALQAAQKAQTDLIASGKALPAELKEAENAVKALQDQVNQFGKDQAQVNAFFAAFKKGGQQSESAMWGFSDAYGNALGKVIAGEESMGTAMEAATKQFITQIGMRAITSGMFALAQGIAWEFTPGMQAYAAGQFTAAAEFLAVGGAAVAVGSAIPGGSGSSSGGSSTMPSSSPIQTTGSTSQSVATQTNVQRMATGGLVTNPTMAILGDSTASANAAAREAVLPLDSPEAMAHIAGALAPHIAAAMGGGVSGIHHNHSNMFFGKPSVAELRKLARAMNQATNKGTVALNSTRTGRIVKRSA